MEIPEWMIKEPIIIRETTLVRTSVNGRDRAAPLDFSFATYSKIILPIEDAFILSTTIVRVRNNYPNVKSVIISGQHSLGGGFMLEMHNKNIIVYGSLPSEASYTLEEFTTAFVGIIRTMGLYCSTYLNSINKEELSYHFQISDPERRFINDTLLFDELDFSVVKNVKAHLIF